MKLSSKRLSVQCFSLNSLNKLKKSLESLCSKEVDLASSKVFNLLSAILSDTNTEIPEVIKSIKSIKLKLVNENSFYENLDVLKLFCDLYVLCNPKHPCKSQFASVLLDKSWNQVALSTLINDGIISLTNDSEFSFLSDCELVQTIDHFCQNFSSAIDATLTQEGLLYIARLVSVQRQNVLNSLKNSIETLGSSIHCMCIALRCGAVLIQRNTSLNRYFESVSCSVPPTLSVECVAVLQLDNVGWECWSAAGALLSLMYLTFYSKQQCLKLFEDILDLKKLESGGFSYASYVGLCTGFLTSLSSHVLKNYSSTGSNLGLPDQILDDDFVLSQPEVQTILETIFSNLSVLSSRVQTIPEQVSIAKCLVQWTVTEKCMVKIFHKDIKDIFPVLKWLHSYATVNLDHQTDVIRHQAKDIIINILSMSKSLNSESNNFLQEFVGGTLTWDWHKRSVYIFLQCAAEFVGVDYLLQQDEALQNKLLTACLSQSLAPYSSHLYCQLARMHDQNTLGSNPVSSIQIWFKPVLNRLLECDFIQARLLFDYCAVKLLKLYGRPCEKFLISYFAERDKKNSPSYLSIFIMCLRTSHRLGFLQKDTLFNAEEENGNININTVKAALVHENNQIRLDTFSLVCESWKSTSLISSQDMNLIRFSLPYNMNCHCSSFRQQLITCIKKFLQRLSLNIDSLTKRKENKDNQHLIIHYKDFKFWLLDFCLENIFPGACYPRKSMSLNITRLIVNSFLTSDTDVEITLKLFTMKRVIELIGLLKDNYDDNRNLTLDILTHSLLKEHVKKTVSSSFLWNLVESSLVAGRSSCKPEVCRDASFNLRFAAKIHQSENSNVITMCRYFVSSLRDDVKIAKRNLLKAVETGPMYGSLLCLRMLLTDADISNDISAYRKLLLDSVHLCFEVASAVFPVVGAESPEGYVPDTVLHSNLPDVYKKKSLELATYLKDQLSTNGDSEKVSGQRILVMCWRSAKESYLLLQLIAILASKSLSDKNNSLLSIEKFLEIGEHLHTQLMDTVHRGTFEVAYSAFRDYLPLLWKSKINRLQSRPKAWIYNAVADICDPDRAKSVCATRRSAGLPFFMQALLGSDKSHLSRDCLSHVMNSLLPLVSCKLIDNVKENDDCNQQVHTLNVLRGLMKDSSLGEEMHPYLSKCVMAAITGFKSCRWSIRNSSTLLFSALITRIFGVKKEKDLENSGKNRMSSYEIFSKMPELQTFFVDVLSHHVDGTSIVNDIDRQSNLFPVLLLLSRVYPAPVRDSAEPLLAYPSLLIRCGHSPILKCRVMAANALASVTSAEDVLSLVLQLATSLSNDCPANQTHGTLLQLQKLVRTHFLSANEAGDEQLDFLTEFVKVLISKLALASSAASCLVVRSAFFDLCLELVTWYFNNNIRDESNVDEIFTSLVDYLITEALKFLDSLHFVSPGLTMMLESIGKLFALTWLRHFDSKSLSYVVRCSETDVTLSFLRELKKFMKNKKTVQPLLNTELENALINFISSSSNRNCQSKSLSLLSKQTSVSKSREILKLTRRLVDESLLRNDKLVGAIVACQGTCFKQLLDEYEAVDIPGDVFQWLKDWITHLFNACCVERNDVCVRRSIGTVLRTLSTYLLINRSKQLGDVFVDAWKILFTLLVDENDEVRSIACQIIQIVSDHCHVTNAGQPSVDLMSLQLGMDCLLSLSDDKVLEKLSSFLFQLAELDQDETDSSDESDDRLFNRGATAYTFIEPPLLRQLAQRIRVQLPPATAH